MSQLAAISESDDDTLRAILPAMVRAYGGPESFARELVGIERTALADGTKLTVYGTAVSLVRFSAEMGADASLGLDAEAIKGLGPAVIREFGGPEEFVGRLVRLSRASGSDRIKLKAINLSVALGRLVNRTLGDDDGLDALDADGLAQEEETLLAALEALGPDPAARDGEVGGEVQRSEPPREDGP